MDLPQIRRTDHTPEDERPNLLLASVVCAYNLSIVFTARSLDGGDRRNQGAL